jgi:hypothetical protein
VDDIPQADKHWHRGISIRIKATERPPTWQPSKPSRKSQNHETLWDPRCSHGTSEHGKLDSESTSKPVCGHHITIRRQVINVLVWDEIERQRTAPRTRKLYANNNPAGGALKRKEVNIGTCSKNTRNSPLDVVTILCRTGEGLWSRDL